VALLVGDIHVDGGSAVSEYAEVAWQSTSALADAYVAVADALQSGRVRLGDMLRAWRYLECLESELEARGVIEHTIGGAEMGEAEEREAVLRDIERMLGLLDLEKLRLVQQLLGMSKVEGKSLKRL
jgi:hypothetical protein